MVLPKISKTKKATAQDVARLAGVSIGTVSAVINSRSSVRPELRKRVKDAMKTLRYCPDQVARSLRTRNTHTIGMIISDITNPFFTSIIRGVEKRAQQCGYSVILCESKSDPQEERRQLEVLFEQRVSGVLISSSDPYAAEDRLTRRRFPIVFFDRIPPGYRGDGVVTDNFLSAKRAVRFLIQLGHKRIAIIAGPLHLSVVEDGLEGYRGAMDEAQLPIPAMYIQQGEFELEGGRRCGEALLKLADPPTAIFVCNNKMTLGLMSALSDSKVVCPDQVSVVSYDDFEWAATFSPSLTTVAQQTYEMGRQAMDLLLERIKSSVATNPREPGRVIVLEAELRVRDSAAPPRG